MSAIVSVDGVPINDGYYLTQSKAHDKRRIAAVKAKNAANARIFMVGGVPMTVKQIAVEINSSAGAVSKEIKSMRKRGLQRFLLSDFKQREAANDDSQEVQSNDP